MQSNLPAQSLESQLLQELYDRRDSPLSLGELETQTGIGPHDLRNALENLKEKGWVLEELDCYFISERGFQKSRSLWV